MGDHSSVTRWLEDADDAASVVSEVSRVAPSAYEEFDEDRYVVHRKVSNEQLAPHAAFAVVSNILGDVANAAHRKSVSAFWRMYSRGRMYDHPDYTKAVMRPQKFFRLENFVQIASLEDADLFRRLSDGVVRARLGAATGLGKTMKLPGMIASRCGLRVCQLELDNQMARDALAYQKKVYQIPGGTTNWSRQRRGYLSCMSYEEFCGFVLSGSRDRLFDDFDVFYMDEAHEATAPVWAARQFFAVYAKEHNSLLVTSATVSTEESNNEVAHGVGRFEISEETVTLENALDSGLLLTKHLRDRVALFVASDEEVALAQAYYLENGLEVSVLDSASTAADKEAVVRKFTPTSAVVPRVLVATETYGTSYNLPLCYVVSTGMRRAFSLNKDNELVESVVPLMAAGRVQHQGRIGRGLAQGAGGWLMTSEVSATKELYASEALRAYLYLIAAGITPRPGLFNSVVSLLPKGIDKNIARMILRIGLPPELVVRYLGTDGLVASKYVGAMQLFAQGGDALRRSKDALPMSYGTWVDETVGHYFVGDDSKSSVTVHVPFTSPPGLKVQMHTISAIADRMLDVPTWYWFSDEEESGGEEPVGIRGKPRRVAKPRMPEQVVRVETPSITSASMPWAYDADPDNAAKSKRRKGMSWTANGDGKAAMTVLLRAVEEQELGKSVAVPEVNVPEHDGKVAYSLPEDEKVPIRSAGGQTNVLLVASAVHVGFMAGDPLKPEVALAVLRELISLKAIERFAKSTVFDNWSPAWMCWFSTYAEPQVMLTWRNAGVHSDAIKLLNFLYDRFRSEVLAVASSSNLYRDQLGGYFRSKPSITKFMRDVKKGKIPIAQSDKFVLRVFDIKQAYDDAVLAVEEVGIFAPSSVTKAQAKLPLRDRRRNMPIIDEDIVPGDARRKVSVDQSVEWRR